jgi:putative transposase
MTSKGRQFPNKLKVKVAVEAIKGIKTLAELSTDYKIHPNQISVWMKQLLTNAPELFSSAGRKKTAAKERGRDHGSTLRGDRRLKMDIKWLGKQL